MENKKINKVCFSVNKISLSGGAERVICVLASEFAQRGTDVTIITQESTECGYPLHPDVKIVATKTSCKTPVLRLFVRCIKLRKFVKKLKPNILISFMTLNNVLAIASLLGVRIPIIVSERIYPGAITGITAKMRSLLYPLCEGFVFQTDAAKEFFDKKIQERSAVIFNPLVDNIPPKSDETEKIIVTAGRMTKQKNHALLIKAFGGFIKENPDYKLVIYGKGEEQTNLENLIKELNLTDKVILPGTTKTLHNEMSKAEMFVLSSDYEGMPNVLAEAMAIGLPCVSTDCVGGGAKALINDRVNGILVPCKDEKALKDAMCEVASNAELAKTLGHNAAKIKETLSRESIAQQWLSYIEKVIF
ncbi:MAG: glycosyltransferase family 4 protein [Clostridia bacterium]|nr:glycosyltransferase family 4 protein [Clostridia bacterium]